MGPGGGVPLPPLLSSPPVGGLITVPLPLSSGLSSGLVGVSQRFLNRHHPRLEKRRADIWDRCETFVNEVATQLLVDDCALDVYLTSTARLMLISIGPWGEPTAPLLFREWDREWPGNEVLLMPKPMRLRGDVSLSF